MILSYCFLNLHPDSLNLKPSSGHELSNKTCALVEPNLEKKLNKNLLSSTSTSCLTRAQLKLRKLRKKIGSSF